MPGPTGENQAQTVLAHKQFISQPKAEALAGLARKGAPGAQCDRGLVRQGDYVGKAILARGAAPRETSWK